MSSIRMGVDFYQSLACSSEQEIPVTYYVGLRRCRDEYLVPSLFRVEAPVTWRSPTDPNY
ncbi:hypothetical protein ACFL27_21685 [candidate division CSSED10-310 bacterium]|uniref:Uncharacterized protein n=1 Tax=candidate division CSSED10-310 bacterium TaxID=2855610 RepID=A0ABV6Z2Y6_UNCC1